MNAPAQDEAQPLRLLLVEDNPADARLFQEELRDVAGAGFAVRHVARLAEALACVGLGQLDVVLLDLSLPDGQGLSNVTRLLAAAPGLPLVVLTGTDDPELAVQAVHAGAQDYLVKGQVTGPLLVRAVRYAIERKRVEEGLKREEAARQTAAFRELFVGMLGHDLRNPLQAISGNAALLLRYGSLTEPQRKAMQRISQSADRMGRMIADVLDFTRSRLGGGYPITRAPVDLHEVVRQVVEELEVANPSRRIELRLSGSSRGDWDGDRMAQVVSNLVSNALQYSPETSPVQVEVRDDEGQVRLEVHNEGPPIPAERLADVFDPFVRAQEVTRGSRKGLGLGLYITQEIVRAHGGRVQVSSSSAEGTCFWVRVPRREPAPAPRP